VRAFPERPIVGVGAVVLDADRVVLVKRAHPPLQGEWNLPGGGVEVGETLADAIVREVREETGLDIEVGPIVEVLDRIHRAPDGRVEYHYVLVDFLCRCRTIRAPASGTDAADAAWVKIADLSEYGVAALAIGVIHKALELSVKKP
jgi:8-oxo-dGTP diphosphatase